MFQTWNRNWPLLDDRTPGHQGALVAYGFRLFRCSVSVLGGVEKLIFRADDDLKAADVQEVIPHVSFRPR